MRCHHFLGLLIYIAECGAETHGRWPALDAHRRGVLYAPRVPYASPLLGDDLFKDANLRIFERDMQILHELGASSVMLEPIDLSTSPPPTFLQALYNASNFIPFDESEDDDVALSPLSNLKKQWSPIQMMPTLDLTGLNQQMMTRDALQEPLKAHAHSLTTPGPPTSRMPISGVPFGAGSKMSKENTQALVVKMYPNKVDGATACKQTADDTANMTTVAQLVQAGLSTGSTPILFTLQDEPGCAVHEFLRSLSSDSGSGDSGNGRRSLSSDSGSGESGSGSGDSATKSQAVSGFVVKLDRSLGCDLQHSALLILDEFDRLLSDERYADLQLWFSFGIDAFDSFSGGEYAAVRMNNEAEPPAPELVLSDARTECLLSLMDGIDQAASGSEAKGKVGVIVEEYSDSFWRAIDGEEPNINGMAGCDTSGDADGASGSYQRMVATRGAQLSCGTYLKPPTWSHTGDTQSGTLFAMDLSMKLACDPYTTTMPRTPPDHWVVPPCADPSALYHMDHWVNLAYDGLMGFQPDQTIFSGCESRYFEANATLFPRRAFYALQQEWYSLDPSTSSKTMAVIGSRPLSQDVTVPWMWYSSFNHSRQSRTREADFWNDAWYVPTAWMATWAAVLVLLFACLRGLLRGIPSLHSWAGRLLTVLCMAALWYLCAASPLPVPEIVASTLIELLWLAVFLLFWAPLNGGGSRGDWWWVHFATLAIFASLQAPTCTRVPLSRTACTALLA